MAGGHRALNNHRALTAALGDVRVGLPPLGAPEPAEYAAAVAIDLAAAPQVFRVDEGPAGLGGVGRILGLKILQITQ